MAEKFRNKYRVPSARLQSWDYSRNAAYFVTIVTSRRWRYFGKIKNGIMIHSEIGKIAHKFWAEITSHFPYVELDEFVIMPDHIHGIIILKNPLSIDTGNENKPASLPTIIRSYKSAVSREAHGLNKNFAWLPRYYDHIIRNDDEFIKIKNYIRNNPMKMWEATKT